MLDRLLQLLEESGEDEYGAVGPSQHAFATSVSLIRTAERRSALRLLGSPTVDSMGGIRVTWKRRDRQIRLICPSSRTDQAYVYVQNAETSKILKEVTPNTLVEHWIWLVSGGNGADSGS